MATQEVITRFTADVSDLENKVNEAYEAQKKTGIGGTVKTEYKAEDKGYSTTIGKLTQRTETLRTSQNGLKTTFENVRKNLGQTILTYAGYAAAITAARKIIVGSVDAYREQQKVQEQLKFAIKGNADALIEQAAALQRVTTVGDEEIIRQQAYLASLGFTEDQIRQIVPAALDLAAATGQTLDFAIKNLAKTFGGLTGELGESIPALKQFTPEELKAGKAVEYASKQFAGQAEALANTDVGKIQQMNNALGDLGETIGGVLSPAISSLAEGITTLITGGAAQTLRQQQQQIADTIDAQLKKIRESTTVTGNISKKAYDQIVTGLRETLQSYKDNTNGLVDLEFLENRRAETLQRINQVESENRKGRALFLTTTQAAELAADKELLSQLDQLIVARNKGTDAAKTQAVTLALLKEQLKSLREERENHDVTDTAWLDTNLKQITALEDQIKAIDGADNASKDLGKTTRETLNALNENRLALRSTIQDLVELTDDEALKSSLSEIDKAIIETAQTFDDRAAKIVEAFKTLRQTFGEGTPQADVEAIQKLYEEENRVITGLVKAQTDAESAIRSDATAKLVEERKDAAEQIRNALLDADEAEIQAIADKYQTLLDLNEKYYSELGILTAEGEENRRLIIAASDAEIADAREAQRQREFQKIQDDNRDQIALIQGLAQNLTTIIAGAATNQQSLAESAAKQVIFLALDVLEKLVTMWALQITGNLVAQGSGAGVVGALAGFAEGAAITAIIQGLFAGIKSAIGNASFGGTQAYQGEELVGANGSKPQRPGRDGYLYWLDKNEGVVDADTNLKYLPWINAMRDGKFGKMLAMAHSPEFEKVIEHTYVIEHINRYFQGDTGSRMASSVMLAKYYDKNIVSEQRESRREQAKTNKLLEQFLSLQPTQRPSKRTW